MRKPLLVLTALLISSSSVHATPPQDHLTISRPGQLLRFWFNPKHGWQATSYDQRYPGCTRQQIHKVYTADVVRLPSMLKNPDNLHWLPDPQEAQKQALYVGSLGLPGGMPSKRAVKASTENLKTIVRAASKQGKMGNLKRVLARAKQDADFGDAYDQVFGAGSSEQHDDLIIFDLTAGEVRDLPEYRQLVFPAADDQKQESDAEEKDDGASVRPQYGHGIPSNAGQAIGPEGLIKHLQQCYEQDNKLPPLLDDKAQSLESYYVRLVMRTTEETRQQQEARRKPGAGLERKGPDSDPQPNPQEWEASLDYKLLYQVKKPIEAQKLWGKDLSIVKDNKEPYQQSSTSQAEKTLRHCCILGQAGSGKTTMTRYITYQWAKGKLWRDRFAWIMRLPLRWVYMLKDRESVPEFLAGQWQCHVKDLEQLLKQPKGLIILDGWDEVAELLQEQESHPLQRFLDAYSSQEGITWLTTSRPYATLPTHVGVDRQCDLIGFQQADVATYVEQYFRQDPKSGQELLRRLEDLPELRLLSQVPLYTRFLCLLKRRSPELFGEGERLPIAYLYHKLVRSFLRYRMSKHHGVAKVKNRTDRWLDKACASTYTYLGKLAFKGLAERQILISSKLQNRVESSVEAIYQPDIHAPSYRHQALATGLLQTLGQGNTPVYFAHLSLQEWFVAHHVAQNLYAPTHTTGHKHACEVLQQHKYDLRYRQVLPLTAGLLYQRYVDSEDHEAYGLHLFWRYVLSDPQELVGIHQVALNMRCMEACSADTKGTLGKLHRPILNEITSWVLAAWDVKTEECLTTALLTVLENVWRRCPCVLSHGPLMDGVLDKLRTWKQLPEVSEREARGILHTLERLDAGWPQAVRQALYSYASSGCKHPSWQVRRTAARSLSQGLEHGCSKESSKAIVQILITLCKDEYWQVREAAAGGLSKGLQGTCSEEPPKAIVQSLTALCKDKDHLVRRQGAEGLSKTLACTCSDEKWHTIVQNLSRLCKDEDQGVRKAAVGGLSKVLKEAPGERRKAILQSLKNLCQDGCKHVRRAAASVWSKGLEAACSEASRQATVESLRSLCRDKDSKVRKAALEGLSKVLEGACSQASWQVIVKTLSSLCKDGHISVRSAASEGLSKALVSPCSDRKAWETRVEVFRNLCKARNVWIHWKAVKGLSKALGKCSEERGQTILATLRSLCNEGYIGVRSAATEGLSKALEAAYTEEAKQAIIETLTGLCKDKAWIVRNAAAESLSKALGECSEQSWSAIVASLSVLCKDVSEWVRRSAAGGLSKALEAACSEEHWQAIVASLSVLCKDGSEWVRSSAAEGLSKALQGKYAKEGRPIRVQSLKHLCKDQSYRVRETALRGLSKALDSKCSEERWQQIVEILKGLSKDKEWMVRRAALKALSGALKGKCSKQAWELIVETFTSLCKDRYHDVREAAAQGLSKALESVCSDEAWQSIKETLKGLCKDENWEVRSTAAFGLSKALVAACSEASWQARVENLIDLCKEDAQYVRSAADQALVRAMRQQERLVRVLMHSESPSSTLMQAIATHSPCLVLPVSCDEQIAKRIKQSFAQERKSRGWPSCKALSIEVSQGGKVNVLGQLIPEQRIETQYHEAARKNDIKLLETCQSNGLDINDQYNKAGKTPLMIALEAGHQEATEWLLAHGAWVDVADKHGCAQSVLSLTPGPSKLGPRQALLCHRGTFPAHRIIHVLERLERQLERVEGDISAQQYRKLLHQAVGSLVGKSVVELRKLIAGNYEWYKAVLENRTSARFERRGSVYYTGGATVSGFLVMRIYIMTELLAELPNKRGLPYHKNSHVYTKKQVCEALLSELCVALTTLWDNAAINICRDDYDLVSCFVESVLKRLDKCGNLEMSLALGYGNSLKKSGHCVYTTLIKRDGYLVVRNDNRWLGTVPKSTGHQVEPRVISIARKPVQMDHVKPYAVAYFPLSTYSKHKTWLKDYLEDAVRNYVDMICPVTKAMHHLYQVGGKGPCEGEQPVWITDWPYRPVQTTAQNCVMRSYNVGCHIRLGEDFYRWFREQESCSPLFKRRFTSLPHVGDEAGRNRPMDSLPLDSNLRRSGTFQSQSGKPLGTFEFLEPRASNRLQTLSKLPSHPALMRRLARDLDKPYSEVLTGIAVETALVRLASVTRSQNGAHFRRDNKTTYTNFWLRLSDSESMQLVSCYMDQFPGLLKGFERQDGGWMRVDMDTRMLYEQVSPQLGQHLKSNQS